MATLDKKKPIYIVVGILICFSIICLLLNFYRKPIKINKTFTGICRNNLTNEFTNDMSINLDTSYERAYTIERFKLINRLTGYISINDKQYELLGIKIKGQDGKVYIGATAYENGNSKYFIFITDDFSSIVLSELNDNEFIRTIAAPSNDITQFNKLLDNLIE